MIKVKFYGADWCPDCLRAKAFLNQHNIEFEFVDVDLDKAATDIVEQINHGKRIIPTIEIEGNPYTNPDNAKLACIFGINPQGRVQLYGADWCPDCRRAKHFLQDNAIHFQFIDVDKYPEATAKVEEINHGKRIIPTILIGGQAYTNPDNAELTEVLGIEKRKTHKVYDTVIIGGGAAGLTAAIYAQRDKYDALILEKKNIGGNAFLTDKIENYPGFDQISGPDLMQKMEDQALTYGATIETGVAVQNITKKEEHFEITTNMGKSFGKTVILATGSTYRLTGIPGEKDLIGSGIHFCATCDGAFYRDKEVIVIGGGNSALEEGIFLSQFTSKVKIVHRKQEFSATKTYTDKLSSAGKIETFLNKKALEFRADAKGNFQSLLVEDNETGEQQEITADGVFIFIGQIPNTSFLEGIVDLNEKGSILTTGFGKTSVEGIFAAGDCREGAIAQVAAATGEGIMASYGIKNYLSNQ